MANKEINKSFLTGCKVLESMMGHEFRGRSSAEISKTLDIPANSTLRYLSTLEQMGWVEQDDHKRWRISPLFAQHSHKINNSIASAAKRVDELAQRYLNKGD